MMTQWRKILTWTKLVNMNLFTFTVMWVLWVDSFMFLGTAGWDDDESNHPVSVATFGMNKFGRMIKIYLWKKNIIMHFIPGNDVKTFPTTDLFERFFDVVETVEDEMKAECNLCADRGNCKPGMAIITGDSTKTVFKDHVKVSIISVASNLILREIYRLFSTAIAPFTLHRVFGRLHEHWAEKWDRESAANNFARNSQHSCDWIRY